MSVYFWNRTLGPHSRPFLGIEHSFLGLMDPHRRPEPEESGA